MGVKASFYTQAGNNILILAPRLKLFFLILHIRKNEIMKAYITILPFKSIPAPFTAFQGIYSLLPGEMLIYSNWNITKGKWWKIKFH